MEMRNIPKIAVALTLAVSILMVAGCSKTGSPNASTSSSAASTTAGSTAAEPTAIDPASITGTVNYACYDWDVNNDKPLIQEFNKIYPNITVNPVSFPNGNLTTFLTTQAASGTLPDMAYGWENINFPISQGWVLPIDEYLAKDPEYKYLDANFMEAYKFNGKTYAVPVALQFSAILVNLDLIDQLNLDKPSYEWTIDQFKDLGTKATTDKTSAINHLWDFDDVMNGMYSKDLVQRGYSTKENKFNFTEGGFVKAVNLTKELKAVPGFVSDDLKNQALRDEGKEDDYQKKFGKDADALRESKVIFGFHGTWDWSWISTMNYKFDFYPLPQDPAVGYREGVHADHAFLLAGAKDPQAAYEFMKFKTFGKDGCLVRLEQGKNYVNAEGKPAPSFFIPATSQPEVIAAFKALEFVPEGIKYMYDNKDKGFRADVYKFVPDYSKVIDEVVRPQIDEVKAGKADASAIAAELEKKANDALAEARTKFESTLK